MVASDDDKESQTSTVTDYNIRNSQYLYIYCERSVLENANSDQLPGLLTPHE